MGKTIGFNANDIEKVLAETVAKRRKYKDVSAMMRDLLHTLIRQEMTPEEQRQALALNKISVPLTFRIIGASEQDDREQEDTPPPKEVRGRR